MMRIIKRRLILKRTFGSDNHQRGFTLIEALVALVILSVVIANVAQWIGTAQTTTAKIQQAHELPELFAQVYQQIITMVY